MIEKILSSLQKVKTRGQGRWMALCPVHNEKTPSLSIKQAEDGRVIMHCFGCGANGLEIIKAINLEPSDLFPPSDKMEYKDRKDKRIYFNAHDVLVALQHEIGVTMLAAKFISNGETLNKEDYVRVRKAYDRISNSLNLIKTYERT